MRARRLLAVLLFGMIVVGSAPLAAAAPARADDPVAIPADRLVDDRAGVLSASERANSEASLDRLTSSGVELRAVLVDTFTNPSDATEWAQKTREESGLGWNGYLLAIATGDGTAVLVGAPDGPIAADKLRSIQRQNVATWVASGSYTYAISGAATGLRTQVIMQGGVGEKPSSSGSGSGSGSSSSSDGGRLGIAMAAVFVGSLIGIPVGLIVLLVVLLNRGRVGKRELEAFAPRAQQAALRADEAVTAAQEELGFALAEFGQDAVGAFQGAVDVAEAQRRDLFAQLAAVNDAAATPADRLAAAKRVETLSDGIVGPLAAQASTFEAARAHLKNLPSARARLAAELAALTEQAAHAPAGGAAQSALTEAAAALAAAEQADGPQAALLLAGVGRELAEVSRFLGVGVPA